MKFRIGDIVRLKNLKGDWRPSGAFKLLATITGFGSDKERILAELTFFDGYCDTYWIDEIVRVSKNNDTQAILQPETRHTSEVF